MAEGAVISNLVGMLTEYLRDGISPIWRVREQVEPLCAELKAMQCLLRDMDGKEGCEATVKNWLSSVREVAYEAEDLIEDFMIEGQKYAPFRAPMIYNSYGKRIEEMKAKISSLVELRKRYVLHLPGHSTGQLGGSAIKSHVGLTWRRASSYLNDDPIIGFQKHTYNLMKLLLSPDEELQVIGITGMGGVGKTTLASVVYNEAHKVENSQRTPLPSGSHLKESGSRLKYLKHFKFFAWVTVGQDPDIPTPLMIILAQGNFNSSVLPNYFNYNKLFRSDVGIRDLTSLLLELLSNKRYLIVLDDVWSSDLCSQLMQALPDRKNGSRIILTSRQKTFLCLPFTRVLMYELKPLNEEESWQLFLNIAFPQSNQQNGSSCPEELEGLGRELSKRCYGLPLALLVLGGLVCRKGKNPAVWIELLESLNWVATKDGQECLDVLTLSYCDLSYHVKPCFLYLGAFRPDSEISTSKLIKVWAGDGLISEREGQTNEEVGFEYLDELIQRCMVQVAIIGSDNRVKRIRVHGLLSELALSKAKESDFLYVSRECNDKMFGPKSFHRRVAFHRETIDFSIDNPTGQLRAMLIFPKNEASKKITVGGLVSRPCRFYHKWALRLFKFPLIYSQPKTLTYIRVLELEGVHVKDDHLKFQEGDMLHLRYLGLRNTNFVEFPFSRFNLQCLQTLDIRGTSIKTLPINLWLGKALEHLYLNSIQPPSINALKSLQTLVGVLCPKWIARGLSGLTKVRYLQMELIDISCGDELVSSLRGLSSLMSLKLCGKKIPQEVIGATKNHQRLFKLNLQGELQPSVLPAFEEFARYLTQLTLSGASLMQDPMSTLKQLKSLRVLKLKDKAYVGQEIVCSSGGFFELQYLKLSGLCYLENFQVKPRALPSLTCLSIHSCLTDQDNVIAGLEHVTTLQTLKIKGGACKYNILAVADFCQRNNVLFISKGEVDLRYDLKILESLMAGAEPDFDAGGSNFFDET